MSTERIGQCVFTLLFLCAAVADYYREKPLDASFAALVFLAALPWGLPWLATFVKTLKVGAKGIEIEMLKQEVKENREMIQATASAVVGVGRDPQKKPAPGPKKTEAVSHGIAAAEEDDYEGLPIRKSSGDSDDPNFALFGNNPVAGGRILAATVKPFPGSDDWFMIHAEVASTDPALPLPDGTVVRFYLHPTFENPVVEVRATNGVAAVNRVAWGWFTIGAEVGSVKLGLPLNTVPGAPERFKSR